MRGFALITTIALFDLCHKRAHFLRGTLVGERLKRCAGIGPLMCRDCCASQQDGAFQIVWVLHHHGSGPFQALNSGCA